VRRGRAESKVKELKVELEISPESLEDTEPKGKRQAERLIVVTATWRAGFSSESMIETE
jgi:hypothetical protein